MADALVKNLILEGEFDKIPSLLDVDTDAGSQSFNKDLYRLVKDGTISKGDAMKNSSNPQALEMNLKGIFLNDDRQILG